MCERFKLSCVLFDLDGTLVDTSEDLITALNVALRQHQHETVTADAIKPYISFGAPTMIQHSIKTPISATQQLQIQDTLLDYYAANIATFSNLYPGMAETLATIEALGLKWGVITNKKQRFTNPLMRALNLTHRSACTISGDTTNYSKPHPEPMLTGCAIAGVPAEECVYIGDASHDIAAGRVANMKTLAATYGFLHAYDQPETWGADALVSSPEQITQWINTALCH